MFKVYTCAASLIPKEEQIMDLMLLFAEALRGNEIPRAEINQ